MTRTLFMCILLIVIAASAGAQSPFDISVEPGHAELWHFYQSGFAIRTSERVLVFDYWPGKEFKSVPLVGDVDTGDFNDGFLDGPDFAGQIAAVFFSHEHYDHFYGNAARWAGHAKEMYFIVSPEVAAVDERFAGDGVRKLVPLHDASITSEGVSVHTKRSSDSGVAFLIEVDGLTIYHSGDHAAWNWDGDADAEAAFVDDLAAFIGDKQIDIAFHVCDPRLAENGWGGFVAFAARFQPKLIVPMHSRGDYEAFADMPPKLQAAGFSGAFWPVARRGDTTAYQP